jgi:hypothetical protein
MLHKLNDDRRSLERCEFGLNESTVCEEIDPNVDGAALTWIATENGRVHVRSSVFDCIVCAIESVLAVDSLFTNTCVCVQLHVKLGQIRACVPGRFCRAGVAACMKGRRKMLRVVKVLALYE